MPSEIIQNYLNDTTIDIGKRKNLINDLGAGMPEASIEGALTSKYGDIYSVQAKTIGEVMPSTGMAQTNFIERGIAGAKEEKEAGVADVKRATQPEIEGTQLGFGEFLKKVVLPTTAGIVKGTVGQIEGATFGALEPQIQGLIEAAKDIPISPGSMTPRQIGQAIPQEVKTKTIESLQEISDSISDENKQLLSDVMHTLRVFDIIPIEFIGRKTVAKALKVGTEIIEGAPIATKITKKGVGVIKEGIEAIPIPSIKNAKKGVRVIKEGIEAIPIPSIKNAKKAAEKMSNLAKILPSKVDEFKRLSGGKSHGEWLVERGMISEREVLVKDLSKRFKDSYDTFNDAVNNVGSAKLYKNEGVVEALGELVKHFDKVGDKAKVSIMKKKLTKMKAEGLDAKEILNTKRDFEKNIKVGYKANIATEPITLQFNDRIDTNLRNTLTDILTENGFGNAKELSQEIQLSRFLADNIDKKLGRQSVTDFYSLTDKLLIGAIPITPTAAAGFRLKKLVTSEWWQSKGIKLLADIDEIKKIPEPDMKRIKLKKKMNEFKAELNKQGLDNRQVDNAVDEILKERQTIPKKATEKVIPAKESPPLDKGVIPSTKSVVNKAILYRAGKLDDPRKTGIFLSNKKSIAKQYVSTGEGGKVVAEYTISPNLKLKQAESRFSLIKELDSTFDKNKVLDRLINEGFRQNKQTGLFNGLTAEQRLQTIIEKKIKQKLSKQGFDGVEFSGGKFTDQAGEFQIFNSKNIETTQ